MTKDEEIEKLIRRGNLLNTIGVMRCAMVFNGKLTKDEYTNIIIKNWSLKSFEMIEYKKIIEYVWKNSMEIFREMYILENNSINSIELNFIKTLKGDGK